MDWEPDETPRPKRDMSRSTQTWIIGGILAVIALYGYDYSLKHDQNDPYAPCAGILGHNLKCSAEIAAARMRGGY